MTQSVRKTTKTIAYKNKTKVGKHALVGRRQNWLDELSQKGGITEDLTFLMYLTKCV